MTDGRVWTQPLPSRKNLQKQEPKVQLEEVQGELQETLEEEALEENGLGLLLHLVDATAQYLYTAPGRRRCEPLSEGSRACQGSRVPSPRTQVVSRVPLFEGRFLGRRPFVPLGRFLGRRPFVLSPLPGAGVPTDPQSRRR